MCMQTVYEKNENEKKKQNKTTSSPKGYSDDEDKQQHIINQCESMLQEISPEFSEEALYNISQYTKDPYCYCKVSTATGM